MILTLSLVLLTATPEARPTPADTRVPSGFVSDWAGLLTADQRAILERRLVAFEKDTTHQVVVALYDELPAEPMEGFTLATANRWGVGQKHKNNGLVFFVFLKNKKMRIEVGLGLQKILTNVKAQAILDDTVTPRFRDGDFAGGVEAAVDGILKALRPSP